MPPNKCFACDSERPNCEAGMPRLTLTPVLQPSIELLFVICQPPSNVCPAERKYLLLKVSTLISHNGKDAEMLLGEWLNGSSLRTNLSTVTKMISQWTISKWTMTTHQCYLSRIRLMRLQDQFPAVGHKSRKLRMRRPGRSTSTGGARTLGTIQRS
jgi:hypothetical protein